MGAPAGVESAWLTVRDGLLGLALNFVPHRIGILWGLRDLIGSCVRCWYTEIELSRLPAIVGRVMSSTDFYGTRPLQRSWQRDPGD